MGWMRIRRDKRNDPENNIKQKLDEKLKTNRGKTENDGGGRC